MTYHLTAIERGTFGESSKINEEFYEFLDAKAQGSKVMELVELSDLIGAIEGYVNNKYNLSLDDLIKMKDITTRAFTTGHRTARN